ncbi:MAG: beta-lactamase hydrolase domain-containing protein [Geminicoccaceae bacterium]
MQDFTDLPPGAKRRWRTFVAWLDLIFVDHGMFRLVYMNEHEIAPGVFRSAQPNPRDIARLARRGFKTIINLRGRRTAGEYWLEKAACARHGIKLIDFTVTSRDAPDKAWIPQAKAIFEASEKPLLMHCKSGADRAGLMSVLYIHLAEGVPIDEARAQLSLRYGHIRQGRTGILDKFFDDYLVYARKHALSFTDWVANVYDRSKLRRRFRSSYWADVLVDKILRRE